MTLKKRVSAIIEALNKEYPDAVCSLDYRKDYELLIAARLSAQCTDERVNIVTKDLFLKYPTLESFAFASYEELCQDVRSCGFYRVKAQNIIDMSRMLLEQYGGVVPDSIEELTKLPGVGRKTANLMIGDIYHKPAIVADTHCIRISNKLGLCDTQDPYKVELALKKIIPPEVSSDFCHQLVWHGRKYCVARRPKCPICPLNPFCPSGSLTK